MSLKAGIVGLPNVGKSSLFSALTKSYAESANYPFTTIKPNRALVELEDDRLEFLFQSVKAQRKIPATFEFVDIAGLVPGASHGAGRGNQFLSNIRGVDLIVHVLRCFSNPDIIHTQEYVDPIRDFELINLELILADMQVIDTLLKNKNKNSPSELTELLTLKDHLKKGRLLSQASLSKSEKFLAKKHQLLTVKPMIVVANLSETEFLEKNYDVPFQKFLAFAKTHSFLLLPLCVTLEQEFLNFSIAERKEYLSNLGTQQTPLQELTLLSFQLLKLATFFTIGVKEVRAWVFKLGSKAPQAAKVIHSDFEKYFIRAQVIKYEDYVLCGSEKKVKEAGKLRIEGQDYLVEDGDIVHFLIGK